MLASALLSQHYDLAKVREDLSVARKESYQIISIVDDVLGGTGYTLDDMRSRRRHKRIAMVRQCLMVRLYVDGEMSSTEVGEFLGKDHTTVLHALNKYRKEAASNG